MGKKKEKNKKSFNHVLEIRNGIIDIRDIFQRIDKRLKEKQEARNGKIST